MAQKVELTHGSIKRVKAVLLIRNRNLIKEKEKKLAINRQSYLWEAEVTSCDISQR